MEFRILGRLEVADEGRDVTPPRPKQRALLALLLLRAGEGVSADEAADALWDGRPPPAARNAVQGHVGALRRLLGRERIATHGHGYLLHLEESELDLHRFERLVTEAQGRRAEEQAELLVAALALFRGAPLEDFRYASFAAAEAGRIDELRLAAVEARIDVELELGRHEQVVPELERLVRDAPLRERPWGQLMLALYRAGRQADALSAYRRAREALDELGLEPGPGLQRLERRILNHDPALDLVSPDGPGARLPTPPTPFLGRETELEDVRSLVSSGSIRLVTLTGAGGIGKTRLALEVARAAAPLFPGGTFFVSLGDVADADLVLPTLARALGVDERGSAPLEEAVALRLVESPVLVVLDNLEHVLVAAPALGRLLATAPALTLLATSREPLRLYGEHLYRVPPLDPPTAETLFLDRAEAVQAAFDRSGAARDAVAEICRRLDRLPLAIELAAAGAQQLSPQELLRRLAEPLELLTDGPVDQPERQQTLRRTLAWSHERLGPAEQRLFARLAIFAGGWTLEAADVISGDGLDLVQSLSSLVDKSLVQVVPGDGEPRQAMLETIREYASEQLGHAAEADELRRRHFDYFLALAERAEPHLRGSPGPWLERLDREHANLRTALDRAGERGEREREQRLAGALWRFWYLRGHLTEGRRRLERTLADGRRTAARAKVLLGASVMAANTGDGATMKARAEEARALSRELGDRWSEAYATFMLGHAAQELPEARALYEQAVEVFRELDDEHSALLASRHLAMAHAESGDDEGARVLHEANLASARASGNERLQASTLGALAEAALREGRPAEAAGLLRESLALHLELGDILDTAVDACRFAAALAATGAPVTAAVLLAAFDELGDAAAGRRSWVAELNEQTLEVIRAALDDASHAAARARGAALTIDEAVALALRPD